MILTDTAIEEYRDCILYGPYKFTTGNKWNIGRKYVCLYNPQTKFRVTVTYARFLMEMHLNKRLDPRDDVHHIDEDFTNDDLSNLEVVNFIEHFLNHKEPAKMMTLICGHCGCEFTRKESVIKQNLKCNVRGKIYCSLSCSSSEPYEGEKVK